MDTVGGNRNPINEGRARYATFAPRRFKSVRMESNHLSSELQSDAQPFSFAHLFFLVEVPGI